MIGPVGASMLEPGYAGSAAAGAAGCCIGAEAVASFLGCPLPCLFGGGCCATSCWGS